MRIINIVFLLHFFRHGMILPLIPLYAQELGASPALIGAVVSAFSLLALFLAIPVGGLTDKLGSRFILVLGIFCNILYAILLLLAKDLWTLTLGQLIGGLGFLFMVVGSQAYVTRTGGLRNIEKGFAGLSFTAALGQTLGPFCGGLLLSAAGFQTVFFAALILALPGLAVYSLKPKEKSEQKEQSNEKHPALSQMRSFLADKALLGVLLFTFGAVFSVTLRSSFLPVLLQEKGFSPAYIGFFVSVFALAATLVRLFSARLFRSYKRELLLFFALALLALGVLPLPILYADASLTMALLIFGFGFGISQPLSMVMVSDQVQTSVSGLAMGLRFTVVSLAVFLGPLILGWVVALMGLEWAFYFPAALLLAVGAVIWQQGLSLSKQPK